MEYPKISIVTPVFNQVKYIEQTIKSVIDQNYPNLEYIILDGGSTDGTLEIIEKYRSRITHIISEKDDGMYYALDKGFKHSTGDIMAWINSDDIYHPKAFFIVAEIFQKFKDVEFLSGLPTTLDDTGRYVHAGVLRSWSKYDYFITGNNWVIQQESTFWKRTLWDRTGGYICKDYKLAGDSELWTRFLTVGNAQVHMLNVLLGGFRVRENQLSSNRGLYKKETEIILQKTSKTKDDIKRLKKIAFQKEYLLKLPLIRGVLNSNKKYTDLFDYPKPIKFDLINREFIR